MLVAMDALPLRVMRGTVVGAEPEILFYSGRHGCTYSSLAACAAEHLDLASEADVVLCHWVDVDEQGIYVEGICAEHHIFQWHLRLHLDMIVAISE